MLLIDKLFHNQYLKKKYKIIKNKKKIIKIDYLYIDDATNAVKHFLKVLLKKKFNCDFLNIGSGHSHKINDVINQIQGKENIKNNNLMIKSHKMRNLNPSISLAKKYGWKPQCDLITGLKKTRNNYKKFKDKFS